MLSAYVADNGKMVADSKKLFFKLVPQLRTSEKFVRFKTNEIVSYSATSSIRGYHQ